jgi:lysophospholipase L1-like esterase
LKVTVRAGPGQLQIERALLARVGADGQSVASSARLSFGGQPTAILPPRASVTSDPISFPVSFRETIAVTLVVRGSAAASAIDLFPEHQQAWGDRADDANLVGAISLERAVAVSEVSVEGSASRAFIALGDSITEGYVEGSDRYVESWPAVAERLLGLPIVNAGVSGQGLDGALAYLDTEVLSAEGITDCLVLLGTNDLGGTPVDRIEANYDQLIDRLLPFCRVHLGVLPPKERPELQADRVTLNAWIRGHPKASGVLDFESVLASPGDTTRFAPGLGMDGIHPTVEGQARMGRKAAESL